jgi:hypothetical protein
MRTKKHKNEKGVALLLSILALMLLSAVAVTMMYMSGTESAINSNFKAEETEYFAARAGIQEVRDRMIPGVFPYSINAINVVGAAQVCPNLAQCLLPSTLPAPGNANGVLYILQNGVTMADVTNFGPNANCPGSNQNGCMADDELCHDYTAGMTATAANVRCTDLPGAAWYSTPQVPAVGSGYLSVAPYALDWKWTRVTLKANSSTAYCVDGTAPVAGVGPPACSGGQGAAQVCWNGSYEAVAPIGTPVAPSNNSPCGNLAIYANPVYVVTSLAVSPSGARRLIQEEMAQTPGGTQPGGLYALGNGCAALQMGGGAKTYSFNSSTEAGGPTNPPSNTANTGGSVGSNGNVSVSGAQTAVQGTTFTNDPATWGNCNAGNGVSGNGSYGTISNIPTYPTAYSPPIPPFPTNPVPPVGQVNYNGVQPLAAGTYGDVNIKGTITLGQGATAANPAVYTMDSIAVSGGGQIVIAGPTVININYHGNGAAVNIGGQGFANNTYVANNFVINYGGPGSVNVQGGASAYAVVNAPNSNVKLTGNANFYGQVLGSTIDDSGGVNFYWDTAANSHPLNTNPYFEISMRELSY